MKTYIFFALTLYLSFSASASFYRNYQMTDGLSSNSVWDIIQDSEGFLWFGTQNGLDRYDGKHFKTYRHQADDSLSIGNNFVHSILEDSNNRMLVGTSKGLYLYDREHDNFKKIPLLSSPDEDVKVNDIMEDNIGNIWIATHGTGLFIINSSLEVIKHYKENNQEGSIPMNFIWTVVSDYKGNIWLGTAGKGLAHFDTLTERFTSINNVPNLDLSRQTIYSLYCDVNNKLWIGTSGMGLFSYNYITGEGKRFINHANDVKSIIKYSDQELIMGTDLGLTVFHTEEEKYDVIEVDNKTSNPVDNSIFTIIQDHEGSYWIGTYFGGVSFFSPAVKQFVYQNNFSENSDHRHIVSSMVEGMDGNIMIATHNNNKIYQLNQQSNQLDEAVELVFNNVLDMLIHQGKLYAGIYGRGVDVITLDGTNPPENLNINVIEGKSIFKTSDGVIHFALESGGGISLEPDGSQKYIRALDEIAVADFTEGGDGSLWVATHTFGALRKLPGGTWESFRSSSDAESPIISNNLNCIYSDTRNRLWIGSKDSGLILFDPDKKTSVKIFDTSTGMPSNKIFSIIDDTENNIWICTEGGIVRISADLQNIRTIGVIENGSIYNKTALRSSSNRLFFGGANGFISIDPQNIVVNNRNPNIALTGFRLFNKDINPGTSDSPLGNSSINNISELTLAHNQSNFSFDFVALSFMVPDHNQYSYILEGFDTEWNITNENKAAYMNIPPGEYVFKVKGANNDGVWSDTGKSVSIRIKPHFLLSPLMLVLYFLGIISLTLWSVMRYHRYIEIKNKEVLYKRRVVQEKEMYESKIGFFTNIAHEIRTPLSLISGPLESILISEDGNDRTRHNLKTIERNANRLLELINQLLDFRKIEHDKFLIKLQKHNLSEIVEKVVSQYSNDQNHESKSITFHPDDHYECLVDAEAVFKIISNLVSNAVKFAETNVNIQIKVIENSICVSVSDDGPGIEKLHQTKIFEPFYQVEVNGNNSMGGSGLGLPLAQSLAEKMGGQITVYSVPEKGTCFTLELPLEQDKDDDKIQPVEKDEFIENNNKSVLQVASESGTKILIVEDNNELRTFLKESLSENFIVYEASNGKEALDMIDKAAYEVIVSDIVMPEMNGLELCDRLKSNQAYSHLPIILLSAKPTP